MKHFINLIFAGGALAQCLVVIAAAGPLEDGLDAANRGDCATAPRLLRPVRKPGVAHSRGPQGVQNIRGALIGLALASIALTAWAQTQQQSDWCYSLTATDDQTIEGCSAWIQSGQGTAAIRAVWYNDRAFGYNNKGLYDQAIADLTQAIALKSDLAEPYNGRAWSYHLKGEDGQGLPDAEKAVAMSPGDANSIETRAEIYEKLCRADDAIADYRAALKFDPDLQSAKDGLIRLDQTP